MYTRFVNPSDIEGVDALLVIGKGKCEDQLLLLRFFLPEPIFPDEDSIYDNFMAHSKGWVVRRSGGSAGRTSINRNVCDFLHLPGSVPGKVHGSVIVQTEKQYFIYYCSPYELDRTVKCVQYCQPHRGGICRPFSSTMIEKHSGLRSFAASKIATAFLLKATEDHFCIAKEAVSFEFSKIEASIQEGGTLGSHSFFDCFIGAHCEHTIVCHPVGYHNDVFGKGHTNNMENRVVLGYKQYSRADVNFPLGRGGLGNGTYAWALLDW